MGSTFRSMWLGIAAAEAFVRHLENQGVFSQVKEVETRLVALADELQALGNEAAGRVRETENLAAHVLALEAVVAALLRHMPVGVDDIDAAVQRHTEAVTGEAGGSPLVRAIARDILARAQD